MTITPKGGSGRYLFSRIEGVDRPDTKSLPAGEWTVRIRPMESQYEPGMWGHFDGDKYVPGYRDEASRQADIDDCHRATGRIEVGLCMTCGLPLIDSTPGWKRCPTNPKLEQQIRAVDGRAEVVFRRIDAGRVTA